MMGVVGCVHWWFRYVLICSMNGVPKYCMIALCCAWQCRCKCWHMIHYIRLATYIREENNCKKAQYYRYKVLLLQATTPMLAFFSLRCTVIDLQTKQ